MDFYYYAPSPPCRAAMLVARAVGLQLNLKVIDLMVGEQLAPDYVKMNPQHTIPTIDDNGFILTESRAIMEYFVDKYAKDDSLCPKDPQKRARVHQMLFFDASTLFQRVLDYFYPVMKKQMAPSPEALAKVEEGLGFFNGFLEGRSWAAGDDISIADYTLAVTTATIEAVGIDISKYPKVDIWFTKAKAAIPGFDEINSVGVQLFKDVMSSATKKE
ncbi:glutathione S-transferase 1-like [Bacillus rossius redtenbacheri]|uniref:glutathione S-transferase 1-like n=1 Tax=Bacillus rossius redtenbacheri TaxID=93214 RepID=UPI002FDE330F